MSANGGGFALTYAGTKALAHWGCGSTIRDCGPPGVCAGQCLVYRRSLDVVGSSWSGALCAASAFALFHLPNPFLIGVTFLAGLVSCRLYRNVPNVLVLGAAHAAIALVLFYALPFSITHELRVGPGYFTAATETPRVN